MFLSLTNWRAVPSTPCAASTLCPATTADLCRVLQSEDGCAVAWLRAAVLCWPSSCVSRHRALKLAVDCWPIAVVHTSIRACGTWWPTAFRVALWAHHNVLAQKMVPDSMRHDVAWLVVVIDGNSSLALIWPFVGQDRTIDPIWPWTCPSCCMHHLSSAARNHRRHPALMRLVHWLLPTERDHTAHERAVP